MRQHHNLELGLTPELMPLIYRILFHITKTKQKNRANFSWGVEAGMGMGGSPGTESMEGRLSTEPQGKLEL